MQHYSGIPEKVFAVHPKLKDQSALIIAQESDQNIHATQNEEEFMTSFKKVFGEEGPGDYIYLFDNWKEKSVEEKLIEKYRAVIQNEGSEPNEVADTFLKLVQMILQNV